ncbi:MAG: lipoyl(octanoyl) transferase LipB [Clostridiales bacterium]|nr:lipoyl(octanoyl) transferase LipB [Clostridiales bacterium]
MERKYKLQYYKDLVPYTEGLKLQEEAFEAVKNKEYSGVFILLQHKPVYTIGKGGGRENILRSAEFLKSQNIDVVDVTRGGNITFHGPGQIVFYPILDLTLLKKDAHWYVDNLEEVIIRVLKNYGVEGTRKPEYRGVWVDDKKISALGISVKRWITGHGVSFNVNVDKEYFSWINPCGITEFGITSLEDYVSDIDMEVLNKQIISSFEEVFQIKFQ